MMVPIIYGAGTMAPRKAPYSAEPVLSFGGAGMNQTPARAADERINWISSLPFLLFHAVPLLVIVTGISARGEAICRTH